MVGQEKSQDEQYLQLLSIFHYVVGGITALFASIPLIHFTLGIVFLALGLSSNSIEMAPFAIIGSIFTAIATVFILLGWTFALCIILAGRFLARRIRYTFCLVMAGVECLFMPLGTVLGVFTIITLNRPLVKELFETGQNS